MALKRFRNITPPRQWEKRVTGKNSPYYAKRKSVYPEGNRKSELERSIRNLSTQAKISLLQPELAKAKKGVSEQTLLSPALGGDMDSLPDDPWFSKSPEEKYADVIQEDYDTEGEDRILNKLAREEFESGRDKGQHPFADSPSYTRIKEDTEGESELDRIGRENLFSSDDSGRDDSLAQEKKDNEALAGKIGAASKLYSLLKPETPQAAPTIPAAKISRGSVAFPGMKLASQKARRKYFTPKGLMA